MSRTQPVINSRRTLSLSFSQQPSTVKGFTINQWYIASLAPGSQGPHVLELQLYMTERAAYRFNLNSDSPRLFVCGGMAGEPPVPTAITASQEVAAAWMDGERQVLETAMPLAIQVWIEAYLAHHGEAPVEGRKKKGKPNPQPEEKQ
ncbi:DUF3305 domain-containing protein [Aidingimonas halophila]|uniref:DUF3305 domain-containing protein n=1 Tax=Aidingimonas halophila TaxID=574349 RepID=A0A1H3BLB4_9GAMM|nr:DUF3305 domain-containing protein [Aidingimonas halophila]GHC26620.1 hypothetical protein GCM10008094_17480 [Aidingimonas halophila]SDX41879.1 Protein of unknown function [Aidingimonas halophila]